MNVGIWLTAVGLCDLLRATRDATTTRRRLLLVVLGVVLLSVPAVAFGFSAGQWAGVWLVWVVGLVGWLVGSSLALDGTGRHGKGGRVVAFAVLGLWVGGLLVVGEAPLASLTLPVVHSGLLGQVGLPTGLLVAGVGLLQLSTGNIVVRLLLDAVGVPAGSNEKTLKGGRLLGPMERLFIVILAVAGQLTAASVVVAAKGLLRFPELRSQREKGPTDVSEYFLIGSFASWLLALGGWLLVRYA